jgi:hypothetical protein
VAKFAHELVLSRCRACCGQHASLSSLASAMEEDQFLHCGTSQHITGGHGAGLLRNGFLNRRAQHIRREVLRGGSCPWKVAGNDDHLPRVLSGAETCTPKGGNRASCVQ